MVTFWDTSAVVPLLLTEGSTSLVRARLLANPVAIFDRALNDAAWREGLATPLA